MNRVLAWLTVLFVLLASWGCSSTLPSETLIERETPQGLTTMETQLLHRAQDDPEDADALRLLALVQVRLGKPDQAELSALRATRLTPFDSRTLEILGRVYLAEEKRFRALTAFRQAVQLAPDYLPAYVSYAKAQALLGEREKALGTLAEALRREPLYYPARFEQARILYALGKYQEAGVAVEQALRIRPREREALLLQVQLLKETGRLSAAALLARDVLKTAPDDRGFLFQLLDIHRQRGEWTEAREVMRRLRALGPLSAEEALLEAEVLRGQGQDAQARSALESLVRKYPGYVPAVVLTGRELLEEHKPEEALKAFNRAIDLSPTSAEAFFWKAETHYRLGDVESGDTALASAERLQPERSSVQLLRITRLIAERQFDGAKTRLNEYLRNRPTDPQGLLLKSELLTLRGDYDSALLVLGGIAPGPLSDNVRYAETRIAYLRNQYQTVLTLTDPLPKEADLVWRAAYLRGVAFERLDRVDQALAVLSPYLQQPVGQGRFHRLVGYLQLLQGNRAGAEKTFRAGLDRLPRDPLLLEGLSRVVLERGDWKGAKALLETALTQNSDYTPLFLDRLERVNRELGERPAARSTLQRFLRVTDPLLHEPPVSPSPNILYEVWYPTSYGNVAE